MAVATMGMLSVAAYVLKMKTLSGPFAACQISKTCSLVAMTFLL